MKLNLKERNGITLIALVITIIVLLILAGVTIATLTGDNGILKKAGDAKTQTEQAKEDENLKIAIAGSYGTDGKLNLKDLKDNLKNQGISTNSNEFPLEVTVNGEKKKIDANGNVTIKLESVADSKTNGTVFNDVTTLEDTYGNQVKIPKGFKIANDSATEVTGGIVIEDATYTNTIGSQFVWIPVGTGEKNAIKKANKETVDIALGRYEFTKNSDGTITTSECSDRYFTEDTTASHNSDYKNAIANNIEAFETSVKNNHGYYIGRYEAGKTGNDGFDEDNRNWTGTNIQVVCKAGQEVWNYIKQPKASEVSRNMYGSEAKVTSDLINSYAWDTAIVFIQKCGTESNSSTYSSTYGYSSTSTSEPQTTGTNILKATSKVDKQCNIFDMAGNCFEWTTETYSGDHGPCVIRGGYYNNRANHTSNRCYSNTSDAGSTTSFRPLLYL